MLILGSSSIWQAVQPYSVTVNSVLPPPRSLKVTIWGCSWGKSAGMPTEVGSIFSPSLLASVAVGFNRSAVLLYNAMLKWTGQTRRHNSAAGIGVGVA